MSRTRLFSDLRRYLNIAFSARSAGIDPKRALAEMAAHDEQRALRRRELALSRRQFLGAAAGTAAAVGLSACGSEAMMPPPSSGQTVAVIGGGMAGLHCAYRLMKAGVDVTVFEASDRTGGRMFTARGMYQDKQVFELGGELIDSGHATIRALAEELGVQIDDLFTNEPAGFERDSWYFNDGHVPAADIIEAFTPVAMAMASMVKTAEADDEEFARIDEMTLTDWLDKNATDPVINELLRISYVGEYGLEAEEQSPFNLFYLIDYETVDPFRVFGDSDERYHTHLGNDTLTGKLATALGDRVQTGRPLTALSQRSDGTYRVTLGGGDPQTFDHVVLAIPFSLLREVDLSGVELPPEKRQVINELGYGTNAKLMSQYTSRVWKDEFNRSGASISDTGLQFTWETSRGQDGASGILTNFVGGQHGLDIGSGTAEEQQGKALPLLDAIYPGTAKAYIENSAVRMHWPTHRWTKGSYACYKPGQWAFYLTEGTRVGNLHFCGEHTSADYQGFMEGACETGALVAMEILDDLGVAQNQSTLRVVGQKPQLPQSTYQARRFRTGGRPMRWMQRRRLVHRLLGRSRP